MGHSKETMFDPYYSQTVNLDTQSGFLNAPLQQQFIDRVNGMAAQRDLRASKPDTLGRYSRSSALKSGGRRKRRFDVYKDFRLQLVQSTECQDQDPDRGI